MLKKLFGSVVICCFAGVAISQDMGLPPAPESVVVLRWSSNFAAMIATECPQFMLEPNLKPQLAEYLDAMIDSGIDLENYDTSYAPAPDFDGDSVSELFSKSNVADLISPPNADFCDIAEIVFSSDMLTAAMLNRAVVLGES